MAGGIKIKKKQGFFWRILPQPLGIRSGRGAREENRYGRRWWLEAE
jgi:hypothetical protein